MLGLFVPLMKMKIRMARPSGQMELQTRTRPQGGVMYRDSPKTTFIATPNATMSGD
jgi:hypothetical protein